MRRDSKNWMPLYLRAVARQQEGDRLAAIADLEEIDHRFGRKLSLQIITQIWQRREKLRIGMGQWEQAAADYRSIIARYAGNAGVCVPWSYRLALLLLKAGKIDDYRRLCAESWERYHGTEDLVTVVSLMRMCCLRSGALADMAPVVSLARDVLDSARAGDSWFAALYRSPTFRPADANPIRNESRDFCSILALALARAGRPREGLKTIQAAVSGRLSTYDEELTLARIYQALGERELARERLERARQRIGDDLGAAVPPYAHFMWPTLEVEMCGDEILR
jgi:tetratricopeptide (TPR) repeat protein